MECGLAGGLAGTYTGGLGASAGERSNGSFAFFGGTEPGPPLLSWWYSTRLNPSNRLLLDTVASTVDGQPTNIALNFRIHAAAIDRSGRYVTVYPTGTDLAGARRAAPGVRVGHDWEHVYRHPAGRRRSPAGTTRMDSAIA